MSDDQRSGRTLPPEFTSMMELINARLAPMRKIAEVGRQLVKGIEQAQRDIEALERSGRTDIDDLTPQEARIIVAAEIDSHAQIWRTFRQLRGQLQALGMDEEQAIERIRGMTDDDLARGNVRPRDGIIARLAGVVGREAVGKALGMTAEAMRAAISRAKRDR